MGRTTLAPALQSVSKVSSTLGRHCAKHEIQVVVLADSPRPTNINIGECVYDNRDNLEDCAFFPENPPGGQDLLAAMQPGDELINLNSLICPQEPCPPVIGQVIVHRDTNHLTEEYVRTLAVPFTNRLVEIVSQA